MISQGATSAHSAVVCRCTLNSFLVESFVLSTWDEPQPRSLPDGWTVGIYTLSGAFYAEQSVVEDPCMGGLQAICPKCSEEMRREGHKSRFAESVVELEETRAFWAERNSKL